MKTLHVIYFGSLGAFIVCLNSVFEKFNLILNCSDHLGYTSNHLSTYIN